MKAHIAKRLPWALAVIAVLMTWLAGAATQAADEPIVPIPQAQREMAPPVEPLTPAPPAQAEPSQPTETGPGSGDVHERGFPPAVIPPGTLQLQIAPVPYVTPTRSLDLVANALRLSFPNSLKIDLSVPGNLPVTVPVEISAFYSTSAQRLTQTYASATGTLIRYQDDERDGLPRQIRLDINLRELVPQGKSFTIFKQFTLTPLYDVTVGVLQFFLYADCDAIGKSDITLEWMSPDNTYQKRDFKLKGGDSKFVEYFSWTARNVSLAHLFEPIMRFDERDPGLPGSGFNPLPAAGRRLTPQTPTKFEFTLLEGDIGPSNPGPSTKCKARISYGISRTLR